MIAKPKTPRSIPHHRVDGVVTMLYQPFLITFADGRTVFHECSYAEQ